MPGECLLHFFFFFTVLGHGKQGSCMLSKYCTIELYSSILKFITCYSLSLQHPLPSVLMPFFSAFIWFRLFPAWALFASTEGIRRMNNALHMCSVARERIFQLYFSFSNSQRCHQFYLRYLRYPGINLTEEINFILKTNSMQSACKIECFSN